MQTRTPSEKEPTTTQHIDLAKLPWVLYVDRRQLPSCAGIYFVSTDQEPTAYIGMAECFKTRFTRHHRSDAFEQLIEEYGRENVKIRYWQAPPMPKYELKSYLLNLENQLIRNSKTRFNNTANSVPKIPPRSVRRTYHGPIYVQINQLGKYYVERSEDGTAGFLFSARKLHMAENAKKYHSPAFLISSGTWEEAWDKYIEYMEIKPEWRQYSTLYFLESAFRARWIESSKPGSREEYVLMGDRATFHRIFLNELPEFKEFAIKYLSTGLTNCSSSDFCETLLSMTKMTVSSYW